MCPENPHPLRYWFLSHLKKHNALVHLDGVELIARHWPAALFNHAVQFSIALLLRHFNDLRHAFALRLAVVETLLITVTDFLYFCHVLLGILEPEIVCFH